MDELIAALTQAGRAVADAELRDAPAHVVELRRTFRAPAGEDATELVLRHTVPDDDHWAQFGPGAVGVGWEGGLSGLAAFIAGEERSRDPQSMATFMRRSAGLWGEAHEAAGASPAVAAEAAARTSAFYAPVQQPN